LSSIRLRAVEESDVAFFFAHMQDQEAQYQAAFVAEDPANRDAHNAHWARIMADENVINRTILLDEVVVGHVAKFVMFEHAEITYWIDRAYWGKGIATAALRQFLDEYRPRPIHATVAWDNAGSLRVLEKCGFVPNGRGMGYANARGEEIEEIYLILDD
jgi:RimJ/RimL family protein N-acetyltransferase